MGCIAASQGIRMLATTHPNCIFRNSAGGCIPLHDNAETGLYMVRHSFPLSLGFRIMRFNPKPLSIRTRNPQPYLHPLVSSQVLSHFNTQNQGRLRTERYTHPVRVHGRETGEKPNVKQYANSDKRVQKPLARDSFVQSGRAPIVYISQRDADACPCHLLIDRPQRRTAAVAPPTSLKHLLLH